MGKKQIPHSDDEEEDYVPEEEEMDLDEEQSDIEIKMAKLDEDDYLLNDDEDDKEEKEILKRPSTKAHPTKTAPGKATPLKVTPSKVKTDKTATKEEKPKKEKVEKKPKEMLDSTYDINKNYFYQNLTKKEWEEITEYLQSFVSSNKTDTSSLEEFFKKFPNIIKGNVKQLFEKIHDICQSPSSFKSYKALISYCNEKYMRPIPSVHECYFFPNLSNQVHVVNMLRTCKKTLDIAIFTLTNNYICAAIEEAFNRGIKVRIIADDECCKMWGSDVHLLAAKGIPCKTDNAVKYHMHHKFAVLDNSVVITGSFNWTSQAVSKNQENIFFYENKEIAAQYTKEYNHLWNTFETVIDQKEAQQRIEQEEEKKRVEREIKAKEKAIKDAEKMKEKEKAKAIKDKERDIKNKEKERLKLEKEKQKEKLKKENEKQKAKLAKEKESAKKAKASAKK